MTPLPAPVAPSSTPATAARPQSPARPRPGETAPDYNAVRQQVETTKPKPQDVPTEAVEPNRAETTSMSSAGQPPAPPLIVALPQMAATALPTGAPSTGLKSVGAAALSAAAMTPIFFEDADASTQDASDFAADLLAALNSASSSTVGDLKAAIKIDAPLKAEALPDLDMTADAWLDQLARDITATASHDGKLSFRIVPPQLGRLDINIETRDAGVAVHMKAETREAQSILTSAQPRLESALGQNGIRVAETSVASNGQENLPKPNFIPQKALIEAVNDLEPEADTPTLGRAAGRFA